MNFARYIVVIKFAVIYNFFNRVLNCTAKFTIASVYYSAFWDSSFNINVVSYYITRINFEARVT